MKTFFFLEIIFLKKIIETIFEIFIWWIELKQYRNNYLFPFYFDLFWFVTVFFGYFYSTSTLSWNWMQFLNILTVLIQTIDQIPINYRIFFFERKEEDWKMKTNHPWIMDTLTKSFQFDLIYFDSIPFDLIYF